MIDLKDTKFVKKSTFLLTITILLILSIISNIIIILYYKDKNITVNIPTVLEEDIENNSSLLDITISPE